MLKQKTCKKSALIVDDNEDGRKAMSMWLELRGYKVKTIYHHNLDYNHEGYRKRHFDLAIITNISRYYLETYKDIDAQRKIIFSCYEPVVDEAKQKGLEAYLMPVKDLSKILNQGEK